jgi:EmrB/QacA subfamily drug resistance transporter
LIFTVAVTAMMMASLDQSIVATALPALRHDLHAPLNWAGWTITAYQFGLVTALPVAGRFSDQFGRRRLLIGALVLFTASSIACATATSIYVLIAFRALQAFGGGAFTPSAIGIITDTFGSSRDRAVGMVSSTVPIGSLSGPVLGGILVTYWSWRGVFLINIPIGLIAIVMALRFVPRSRPLVVPKPDIAGVALLAGLLLTLMFGVTALGENSNALLSPGVIAPFAGGALCLVAFVRHLRRTPDAIIPKALFRQRGFATLNVINYLYGGCALGIGALLPLYAQERFHFTSLQAGSFLSARAIGVLTIASTTAFMIRRVGYRRPMIAGFTMAALGMLVLSFVPPGLTVYTWLAIGAAAMGIGNGLAAPSTNNAMLHLMPQSAGSISGIRAMFRQFGAITVVSVSTSIVARSANEGLALSHVFLICAIAVTVIVLPLTFTVPDHRGRW